MRCRKCGESAVINMRHHKLSLCSEHYSDWFIAQTERAIEKYKMFSRDDHVLVAVSGGKDSLALWDVLLQLGYHADGLYIGLAINDPVPYSDQSLDKTRAFLEQRHSAFREPVDGSKASNQSLSDPSVIARSNATNQCPSDPSDIAWRNATKQSPNESPAAIRETATLPYLPRLHVVDVLETYGKTIPQISSEKTRGQGKPCSACGLTKRYVMNRIAADKGYSVLATGHNLDDEAAVLMQNTLRWQTGYLARQSPVLPATSPRFAKKVKPFCRFYERETATYALVRSIDYVYDECPNAIGNLTNFYKTLLNQLESESPGSKLAFYLEFLRARKEGLFENVSRADELHDCEACGQPTTAPGRCAFCRMWDIGVASEDSIRAADEIPITAAMNVR